MLKKVLIIFAIAFLTITLVSFFAILISLYMDHSLNMLGINLTIVRKAGEVRGMGINFNWIQFVLYTISFSAICSLVSFIVLKLKNGK